ncbi:glycosyltransferase family 2 protein [Roseinatronobacter sp.]|uniref:glycosyltransferase family 2 protein n=1 Tax=Roseinatronobacter sp. TaxID=1945755 RepID=UPI0025DE1829|nr:glycosyltransferase family 2 protein [Roseibaca sp.]
MSGGVLTVILNYRTAEMTLRAAQAALAAMEEVTGEIVIVDNDSGDGSEDILRDGTRGWPRTRVIQSGHNGGFGAGNNVGIRAGLSDGARPDFIYLLNSDAFPERDAITKLRDYLGAHPDCGFVGSHIQGEDGEDHITAFQFHSAWSELETAAQTGLVSRLLRKHIVPIGMPRSPTRVDWCAGASVMFRHATLDQVGLFDERFFLYFEETDLCHRISDAGWHGMFLPTSRVVHVGGASTGVTEHARKPAYWFDSRWLYFTNRGGRGYALLTTLAYLAGAIIWNTRRVIERKEDRIPPYFLRDLLSHTMRSLMPGATASQDTKRAREAAR